MGSSRYVFRCSLTPRPKPKTFRRSVRQILQVSFCSSGIFTFIDPHCEPVGRALSKRDSHERCGVRLRPIGIWLRAALGGGDEGLPPLADEGCFVDED